MKSAIINARIQPDLKEDVEDIFTSMGVTTTQAITMFFEQVRITRSIPFQLKAPDIEMLKAAEGARKDKELEPALDLWESIEKFRAEADLSVLQDDAIFADLRDKTLGREVNL